MASQGPNFPDSGATLANAGTSENSEAWVSPGNIISDNASNASITAATYDSPDISQLLVASDFDFTIPDGATIDGIVVEIERNNAAGAASDNRVQLATGTTFATLVGDNKAATTTDWPAAMAIATYGSSSDDWNAGLTVAQINAIGFSVFLSVQADAANTDIAVDFIRVTVHYTEGPVSETPTPGGALAGGNAATPNISVAVGGAVAEGPAPTSHVSVSIGGGIAAGNAPTAPTFETPTPGGGVAAGNTPTSSVSLTIGGALADGGALTSRTSLTQGGGMAAGNAPTSNVSTVIGGAVADGNVATARVSFTIGGALAGGNAPTEGGGGVEETPVPGGAVAAGFGPGVLVSVTAGGALAGGNQPSVLDDSALSTVYFSSPSPSHAWFGTGPSGSSATSSPSQGSFDPPNPIGE